MILITDLKKNDLIEHPKGGVSFGEIPCAPQHGLKGGSIYLRKGEHWHRHGKDHGYGVTHIWEAHQWDLKKIGYLIIEDVASYVAMITQPGTPIYCDFTEKLSRDGRRVSVLRSHYGVLIVEPRHERQHDGFAYHIVTAFPKRQVKGTLVGEIQKAP